MTKNRFDPKNFKPGTTAPAVNAGKFEKPKAGATKRKAPASSVPWKGKQKFATKKAAPKKKTSSAWAVADEEFMLAQKRRAAKKKPVKKGRRK